MPVEIADHPPVPPIPEETKENLAAKISNDFDKAMGNEVDEPEEIPAEEIPVTEKPAAEETETPAATETPAEEAEPEPKTPEAAAPAAPTLPAAYRRTLEALEWTKEEIDDAAKRPELLSGIAKLHQSRNKEMAAWAELGRKNRQAQQPTPTQAKEPVQPTYSPFSAEEIKKLKEAYGDTDGGLVDTLVGRINPLIEKFNQALPIVEQTQARAAQSQAEQLNQQINGFFSAKELEPYKDTYGTAQQATEAQTAQRNKVLEYADALIGGAAMQGRSLTFGEAMQAAHDAVSGGIKEKAAREQLSKQLQARQRGITVKPGGRTPQPKPGAALTRGDLEKRVKQNLAKVLG